MKVFYLAVHTQNLEKMKNFYVKFFKGKAGEKYISGAKGLESYIVHLKDHGISLKLLRQAAVDPGRDKELLGPVHIAFKLKRRQDVRLMTDKLRAKGIKVLCEPRYSGDGSFGSIVADCDGNRIELVAQ